MKKILLSSILLFGVGLISVAQEKGTSAVQKEKAAAKAKSAMLAEKAKAAQTTAENTSSLNQTPIYVSKKEAMKAAALKKN